MEVQAYLDRILYAGPLAPTAETLRVLHRRHMLTVAFENLDIGLGREIVLDSDRFLKKIVNHHRGGFCYELNGALAWLLTALGFRVTLLSARVANKDGIANKEFDHLTLRIESGEVPVRKDGLKQASPGGNWHEEVGPEQHGPGDGAFGDVWLADVGFGDNFLEPLRLVSHVEQQDPAGPFRLIDAGERWRLERREPDGSWRLQYDFSPKARQLSEFAGMCHYHQTSPESYFTRNRICSLATPKGRVTLSGMRLIVTSNGTKEEKVLATAADWHSALRDHFGIVLD